TFIVWLLAAVTVFIFQDKIVAGWHLPDKTALWITMFVVLFFLWQPMFLGVLQGRQDFFWMGWSTISAGTGRLIVAAILVLILGMGGAGMMAGALIGIGLSAFIAMGRTRDLWSLRAEPFDWKTLLRQVMPLLFGFGACQFLFTSDTMFAKAYFNDDQMGSYVA